MSERESGTQLKRGCDCGAEGQKVLRNAQIRELFCPEKGEIKEVEVGTTPGLEKKQ